MHNKQLSRTEPSNKLQSLHNSVTQSYPNFNKKISESSEFYGNISILVKMHYQPQSNQGVK